MTSSTLSVHSTNLAAHPVYSVDHPSSANKHHCFLQAEKYLVDSRRAVPRIRLVRGMSFFLLGLRVWGIDIKWTMLAASG